MITVKHLINYTLLQIELNQSITWKNNHSVFNILFKFMGNSCFFGRDFFPVLLA